MRIVYLSGSGFPAYAANSIHVFKMSNAFAKNKNEVLLIGKKDNSNTIINSKTIEDFYGEKPSFNFHFFYYKSQALGNLNYAVKSFLKGKKFKAHLFYGRHIESCMLAAFLGNPTMLELHSVPNFSSRKNKFFKSFLLLKSLKKIVVISQQLKIDLCKKYDVDAEKIIVAHDAADEVEATQNLNWHSVHKTNIAYTGHLYPGKGIEIIAQLIPKLPHIHFHIIGGTAEDVLKWKNVLKDYSNYTFYGMIKPKETVNYRNAADILIAPYLKKVQASGGEDISSWMSPLKLFEYMSAGKPIVVSDLPVIREILTSEENAILVDPDNIDDWVNQINRLSNDEVLCNKIGLNAQTEFKEKYTWQQRAKNVLTNV